MEYILKETQKTNILCMSAKREKNHILFDKNNDKIKIIQLRMIKVTKATKFELCEINIASRLSYLLLSQYFHGINNTKNGVLLL